MSEEKRIKMSRILREVMAKFRSENCTYSEAIRILKMARSNIERAAMNNKI